MQVFQNSNFSSNFVIYYWQQILLLIFLEITGPHCSFSRKYLPNTCWSNCIFSVSNFFQVKMVLYGKHSNFSSQLEQLHKCFSSWQWYLCRSASWALCIWSHRPRKKMGIQISNVIKLFLLLHLHILEKKWHLNFYNVSVWLLKGNGY